MVNNNNYNNNSSNFLVFGQWPQTKMDSRSGDVFERKNIFFEVLVAKLSSILQNVPSSFFLIGREFFFAETL